MHAVYPSKLFIALRGCVLRIMMLTNTCSPAACRDYLIAVLELHNFDGRLLIALLHVLFLLFPVMYAQAAENSATLCDNKIALSTQIVRPLRIAWCMYSFHTNSLEILDRTFRWRQQPDHDTGTSPFLL